MSNKASAPRRPGSLANLGIGHVGLRVADLEKSTSFYRDILGLSTGTRQRGVARIPSGPDLIVLHGKRYRTSDFHFGFHVDSPSRVDEWRIWFESMNVAIYQDVTEKDYRSIKIRDPDGYWIEITCDKRLVSKCTVRRK